MSTAPAATRAGSARAVPATPGGRAAALLAVLAAVLLAVVLPASAGVAPRAAAAPVDAPAPAPPVVAGVVTATASCLAPDPRDTVAVEVAGVRRELPLEACGNRVGTRVDVRVTGGDSTGETTTAAAGGAGAGEVARVAGTGSDGADPGGSTPAANRLSVLLAIVAAVGGASLLVAVGRERRRGTGGPRTPVAAGMPLPVPRRSAGDAPRR